MLLVGTDLPAADVAFSAGFSSVRQFNETVREVFGMPPLELRARRRRSRAADALERPARSISSCPTAGPFDADGLFAWMGARAISGVESASATSFARTLRLSGGPAWFELRLDEVGRVRLRARLTHLGDLSTLVTRARRLFDLDADPIAVDEALARHPELAPLVARVPGIRVPGAADPHEMLIRAMVGQQITVAAARTALTALDRRARRARRDRDGRYRRRDRARLFPTMAAIAERGHEVLRGPAARTRAIVGAAAALADGTLPLGPGDAARRPASRAARDARASGRGPPTTSGCACSATPTCSCRATSPCARARPRRAARGGPPRSTAWAARTAPWRSYLTAHLWRAVPPRTPARRSTTARSARPAADAPPTPTAHPHHRIRRPSTKEAPR